MLKDVELTQHTHNNAGEWRHLKKNGEMINVEIISHAITFNNRKARHVLVNDVTKQKQVEQEIRELNASLEYRISERTVELTEINENLSKEIEERVKVAEALQQKTAELENFFSVTVDLLLIADTSGKIINVNAAWEVILGYSVEELRNRNFLELIHPDDIEATLGVMSELNKQNPVFNFINRYKKKDGAYRYIEWNSALSNNLFYAAARDITESRQAEEFEAELLKLSPKLTGISFAEIDNALYLALSRIGQFLGADRSSIYEFSPDGITFSNTYEWCSNGVPSPLKDIQRIPCKTFPAWMEAFKTQEAILIPSVNDLPPGWSAEKKAYKEQGIQSLIIIPMFNESKLIGFVGLDAIRDKRVYTFAEINILKVWSSMLASLINNKRVESLLEQTRQNYETFFNTIEDFLFIFNENGNIIDTNQTVIQRLGYTSEELNNQSILMVRPTERREEVLRVMKDMLSGAVVLCTIPLLTKSGAQIPVETKVKRGLWNGQPVIFGVSKDISQIKLSEQKFSSAFHANSAMMTISKIEDGKFVDVNQSTIETMGFSREEIIGKTGLELGFFVDQEIQERIYETKIRNIPLEKIEVQLKTKDDRLITGIMSCETIFIGDEKCLLTVVLDISDRKKGEEELRKARIESEQANKAKSEFLSRMSHELRTPMNSILGFTQLLKMGDLNAGQKKGLNHIMHSGKHLLDLINEVLDISRIEAGRLSLSLEPVQLNAIILETMDIVKPQSTEYQINIELISSPDNQLFVKSDRQRLKQVLLNLINNAIKYNRKRGSVYITIELQERTAENLNPVRVSITDTGIGISSEDIPKLFKPFERIGADKTETEGTGLGLAVVQKLMEVMGGNLGVESIFGEGSTFWIELPVIESQLAKIKNSDGISDPHSIQPVKTGTILYIEDNSSNIELVEQIIMIQRPNIKLITNTLGKNAAPLAMENKPDLILLDLNLPDIHGSEVLQMLQTEVSTSTIPVVVISADAMLPQIKKLLSAGAKDYLTKPIEIDDFLKVIDQYMGN